MDGRFREARAGVFYLSARDLRDIEREREREREKSSFLSFSARLS